MLEVKEDKRNVSLDVLRGIAILLVMLSHNLIMDKSAVLNFPLKQLRLILISFNIGGWSGVDLFFVLSGFLVSGLLFKEYRKNNDVDPGRFFIRRFFKLFPSFAFFIIVTFIIEQVLHLGIQNTLFSSVDYVKDLLFLHNYLGGRWIITWSLDVEEGFYLLLIIFFVIAVSLKQVNLKIFLSTYIILFIWGIAARILANKLHPGYSFEYQFAQTHLRLDALFEGVLLSYLYHYNENSLAHFVKQHKYYVVILAVIMLLPNFMFKRETHSWISIIMLALNPIAFGGILIVGLNSNNFLLKNKLLSLIGRNSYAIYLWHAYVNENLMHYLMPQFSLLRFFLYFISYFIVSIVLAICLTKIIEEPFLRLRNRLFPSKSLTRVKNITPLNN